MFYLVYKITNKINNKVYIGAHKAEKLDDGYMGSGDLIKAAINKYGIGSFKKQILYMCNSEEIMYQKEAYIVNKAFVDSKHTYNLKEGGQGGWKHVHETYWTPEKRSKSQVGRKLTDEAKNKISKIHKGKTVSLETRAKIAKANVGKTFSGSTLEKMSNAKKGKPLSNEHKANLAKAHRNRPKVTCEHCNKSIPIANYKQWHGDKCKSKH